MAKRVKVVRRGSDQALLEGVRWCSSFGCRLVGLQFRRRLKPGEALLLVYRQESISRTSIHMFFVFTPLAVAWVNNQGKVTHVALAQPWRPHYASPEPASYVLEMAPEQITLLQPGDSVDFVK